MESQPQESQPKESQPKISMPISSIPPELDLGIGPLQDLDKLTQQIKKKNQSLATPLPPLDNEKLHQIWQDYQDQCESNIVKAHMNQSKALFLDENHISVSVGSKLVMNVLMKEQALLEEIRAAFKRPQLLFSYQEDSTLKPEEISTATPLRNADKLEKMIEKNPKVAEMMQKLNLKLLE
jgi:hypothetical protein